MWFDSIEAVRAFVRQGYTVRRAAAAGIDFELERQGRLTLVCAKRWKSLPER